MASPNEATMILLSDTDQFLLYSAIIEDVAWCLQNLNKNDTQFWRRAFIRSMFAFVEGMTFRMKKAVLIVHEKMPLNLTEAEIAVLKEVSYSLNDGKAKEENMHITLMSNFTFAYRMYFSLLNHTDDLAVQKQNDSNGFDAFKKAIRIRDRITHPKSHIKMHIKDEEIETVRKAFEWYQKVNKNIFALSST